MFVFRIHLKNRILVQNRGGAEFLTGGILLYFEDLKRGSNKEIGAKDIFEMSSKYSLAVSSVEINRLIETRRLKK